MSATERKQAELQRERDMLLRVVGALLHSQQIAVATFTFADMLRAPGVSIQVDDKGATLRAIE